MTVKIRLIYLICMILCVFITFSTVSAADLYQESIIDDNNDAAIISQSESSLANLNENMNDIDLYNEDEDCVDSMNELFNSDYQKDVESNKNYPISSDTLNSINSDEKSLKPSLDYINSNSLNVNSSTYEENSLKSNMLRANEYTFDDIQDLIDNANPGSTINLEGKVYIGNGSFITINKALTINGGSISNMATLDARKLSEILKIMSNDVHLLNCNFINGVNNTVYISSNDSSLSNCNFKDNFYHLYVTSYSENLTIEYSNFTDAYADGSSSVVVKANKTNVSYCNFINNHVENLGDVQGHGAAMQIGRSPNSTNIGFVSNCNFINNTVISNSNITHAGALCFRPGIVVSNSNFINNYCNKVGGATTLHSDGEIINCTFINNSAGEYGGAISTGFEYDDISVNITNCIFINNSAPMGGAIQIKGHNVKVSDSVFVDNKANESEGGAVFIVGNGALLINSTFDNNFAKTAGAGVLINGSDATILNSSYDNNVADFGAAVYVIGPNANLFGSNFTNHNVKNGSVYINGLNTYVYDCNFINNLGEAGAGLFIEGSNTTLISSNFTSNNVNQRGGAVYIDGSNAKLILSAFLNNNAIPNVSQIESGLGGAIFIKGDDNLIDSSIFNFNTARNGSAIYTDGLNMTLSNTNFDKNQAWSYILDSSVYPMVSYFNESDIIINFTLIGGNNIANAIYNTASIDEIYFYNITYISSKGQKITGIDETHPVNGAENSNNGSLLYQDDREDNQLVHVIVYRNPPNDAFISSNSLQNEFFIDKDIILNKTFITGILGDINLNLRDYIDSPLETGKYYVYAKHFDDEYYKEIDETNEFEIIPIVDLAIDIGSSRVNLDFNKTVKFTVKVKNNGPNNASEVNANAIIPEGLVYLSSSPSIGTYDPEDGVWNIGNLNSGEIQTLIINVQTNKTGLIDYPVNVSSLEDDSNIINNLDNKTIRVLMADLVIEVNASEDIANYGDIVNWTITVANNGPNNASKLVISLDHLDGELIYLDSSNGDFNQTNKKLEISSLLLGEEISFEISTKVNVSNKSINLNATVSSDTFDPIESNNFDFDSVNALPLCDLITEVSVSESPTNKDDIVDWIVVVSNEGPDDASDVVLSLSDLESLGLIVLDSSDDSFDLDAYEWIIEDLDAGESVYLNITTNANKSNDKITVLANVETSTNELNKENNHDDESLEILPICDITVTIMPDNNPVHVDEILNWIINVTNNGPDKASEVNVFNSLPENLELIAYELNKGELENITDDGGNIVDLIWKLGDLDNNESSFLIISTRSLEEGSVLNNVNANSSTPDMNQSNNFDSAAIDVIPLNESSDDNPENPDKDDDRSDDNSEDYEDDDEFPWYDYFLDNPNERTDDMEIGRNLNAKSKNSPIVSSRKSIDLGNKKTGNPFVLVLLSVFALFSLGYRKY